MQDKYTSEDDVEWEESLIQLMLGTTYDLTKEAQIAQFHKRFGTV